MHAVLSQHSHGRTCLVKVNAVALCQAKSMHGVQFVLVQKTANDSPNHANTEAIAHVEKRFSKIYFEAAA